MIKAGLVLQVDDAVLANMYDHLVAHEPAAVSRMGGTCGSPRSTTRSRASPRIASATTSASEAGTCRMSRTPSSRSIVDLILQVNAGAYSIEAANPRHEHEWHVWEKVEAAVPARS